MGVNTVYDLSANMNETEMTPKDWILQEDTQDYIIKKHGQDIWIPVYHYFKNPQKEIRFYCALIAPSKKIDVLEKPDWDFHFDSGMPGFSVIYRNGKVEDVSYNRLGGYEKDGIEPFVFWRNFHELKPSYLEILEEFRHLHNLYDDRVNRKLIQIHDSGEEEDVVVFDDEPVKVKRKQLRQFLGVKEMSLAYIQC